MSPGSWSSKVFTIFASKIFCIYFVHDSLVAVISLEDAVQGVFWGTTARNRNCLKYTGSSYSFCRVLISNLLCMMENWMIMHFFNLALGRWFKRQWKHMPGAMPSSKKSSLWTSQAIQDYFFSWCPCELIFEVFCREHASSAHPSGRLLPYGRFGPWHVSSCATLNLTILDVLFDRSVDFDCCVYV